MLLLSILYSFIFVKVVSTYGIGTCSLYPGAIYSPTNELCYQVFETLSDFPAAENACVLAGGHLAYIDTAFSNSLVYANIKNGSDVWIGAKLLKQSSNSAISNVWVWTDENRVLSFSEWRDNQPNSCCHCGVMAAVDGTWYSSDCGANRPYVCSFPATKSYCDDGWTEYNYTDSCYKVFYSANWTRAEQTCMDQNAHLVSIHSVQEDNFVVDLSHCGVTFGSSDPFWAYQDTWIGLYTNTSRSGEYYWSDKTPTDYMNWRATNPDAKGWACIFLNSDPNTSDSSTGGWDDWDCFYVIRNFVCKKPTTKAPLLH